MLFIPAGGAIQEPGDPGRRFMIRFSPGLPEGICSSGVAGFSGDEFPFRQRDLMGFCRRNAIKGNFTVSSPDKPLLGPVQKSDRYGRSFQKLRLSLHSACNLRCLYCSPGADSEMDRGQPLESDLLLQLVERIHRKTPLRSVRLTGGEPLLYRGLADVIRRLKSLGIESITMTTNGCFLRNRLDELIAAGLSGINLSLDALDPVRFYSMTGGKLSVIMASIRAALDRKIAMKLNATIVRGVNDLEILPLLRFGIEHDLPVRFIELMNMGPLYGTVAGKIVTRDEIIERISGDFALSPLPRCRGETARYFVLESGYRFGIIANASDPFCGECDRLRLDSSGMIYGCLSAPEGIAIRNTTDLELERCLVEALAQKRESRFSGSPLSMKRIGG